MGVVQDHSLPLLEALPDMMRHFRFLLLGLLMLPFAAFEATAQDCDLPFSGPDPDSLSITAALDSVLACALPRPDAELVARRAGESGDRAYVPQLKEIAMQFTTISRSISFNALHALYLLGEPESYFLDNAKQYASDEWLARYSVWVLARDPDSTTYFQVLEPLWERSRNGHLQTAINEYGNILDFEARFDSAPDTISLDFQLMGLTGVVGDGYNFRWVEPGGGYPVLEGSSKSYLHPMVVWGRNRLQALAEQHPQQVLAFIDELSLTDPNVEYYVYFVDNDDFQNYSASDRQRVLDRFEEYLMDAAFPEGPPSDE
jgi:hypothetical protein